MALWDTDFLERGGDSPSELPFVRAQFTWSMGWAGALRVHYPQCHLRTEEAKFPKLPSCGLGLVGGENLQQPRSSIGRGEWGLSLP